MVYTLTTDAGELMHMEGPTTFQQCTSFHDGVLSSVRHHLKKNHFHAFDALLDALQHQDKVGNKIDKIHHTKSIIIKEKQPIFIFLANASVMMATMVKHTCVQISAINCL